MTPVVIKLYTRKTCKLCDQAKEILLELKREFDFTLEEVDIYADDRLTELYGIMIPVVEMDGEEVQYGIIDYATISRKLKERLC